MTQGNQEQAAADVLRASLRTMEDGEGPPAPVEQVIARGRALRRRRRQVWTAAAAVVVIGAVGTAVALPRPASGGRPAVYAAPAPTFAPVRVLAPGEHFEVGAGYVLTMLADRARIRQETGPSAVVDMRKPKTDIQAYAHESFDGEYLLLGGVYIGTRPAAGVVIELDGRSFVASVVTQTGAPGWEAFYVPPTPMPGGHRFAARTTVTVYAPDGSVLARNTSTAVTRAPAPGETVPEPDPCDFDYGPPPNPPPGAVPGATPTGGPTRADSPTADGTPPSAPARPTATATRCG